jgi:hypothetical protein
MYWLTLLKQVAQHKGVTQPELNSSTIAGYKNNN